MRAITDLSKISGLFVIARNSVFTYKGKPVKIRQVAEEMGVRYVLEGSVRRDKNNVRINVQLIDSTTGDPTALTPRQQAGRPGAMTTSPTNLDRR